MTLFKLIGFLILLGIAGYFIGFGGVLGLLIKFTMIAIVCVMAYWVLFVIIGAAIFKWLVATLTGNGVL